MREDELSHRGLMKMILAQIKFLTELYMIEKLEEKSGYSPELADRRAKNFEEFEKRKKQIFAQDKLINERN